MLLAYHPDQVAALRAPSRDEPWRVLVSGCLAAWPCGVDGTDYGMGNAIKAFLEHPLVRALPFCPEQHALGTPRSMPDLHGGDGISVLRGAARALDEHGTDLTAQMISGARAMARFASAERVELAILTDMSAACGSQVISDGCRLVQERRFQKGVGVATAALLEAKVPVVSQRDFRTLGLLLARLDPLFVASPDQLDHHEHAWTRQHLPHPHPHADRRG